MIFILVLTSMVMEAQNKPIKPLKTPEIYIRPRMEKKADFTNSYAKQSGDEMNKDNYWFVYSDRANNPTRIEAKKGAKQKGTLAFGEGPFYVVEETATWIKIVKSKTPKGDVTKNRSSLKEYEDYGWIEKENMLLWTHGLLSEQEGISLKGYVMNKAVNLNLDKLQDADVYDSPVGGNIIGKLALDRHAYIYKIEFKADGVKHDRYLLCTENKFEPQDKRRLKGWVDESKIQNWNTRVALEPNFDKAAFEERKSSSQYHVKGYSGSPKNSKSDIIWDSDPVKEKPEDLKNRRWVGDEFRFPLLPSRSQDFFEAGALCQYGGGRSINQVDEISNIKKLAESKFENLNIFFFIEGSSEQMKEYIPILQSYIKNLKFIGKKIKIGVGIYKDVLESESGEAFKYVPLTENKDRVIKMLEDNNWGKSGDNDRSTIMMSALQQTLLKADFDINSTNMIIQIGNYADVTSNKMRRDPKTKAHKFDNEKENKLVEKFSEYEIHWCNIKITEDKSMIESKDYNMQIRNFMNSCVVTNYNIMQKGGWNPPDPIVPELETTYDIVVPGFKQIFRFLRPSDGKQISRAIMEKTIKEEMDKLVDYMKQRVEGMYEIEESINTGDFDKFKKKTLNNFEPAFLANLYLVNKHYNATMSQEEFENEFSKKAKDERFFNLTYFSKKYGTANHPPFKYVLLFPHEELKEYRNEINRVLTAYNTSTSNIRDALYDLFLGFMETLTSQKSISINEQESITKLNLLLQGIKDQTNIVIEKKSFNFKIKDLKNKRVVTDEDLKGMNARYQKIYEEINDILDAGKNYPYAYTLPDGANVYYWVDLDLVMP